jgi:soluble lytic murein transglycosylase-like protein
MQGELLSSEGFAQDREADQASGCLSVLLWPPFSVLLFGGLLLFALLKFPFSFFTAHVRLSPPGELAAFFAPQVLRWEPQIIDWATAHDLDPNLVATVMQIESCGDPFAVSSAGAQGLFQVMPYHFAAGEDAFVAETNAQRGLDYLQRALAHFNGDASLALAGYNGGINGASRPSSQWAQETRDYQYWGENIYADANAGRESSPVLQEWLAAGGASLCAQAEQRLAQQ